MSASLDQLVAQKKLLLGVVHLNPLPGSPRFRGEPLAKIIDDARANCDALLEAGFDGYVLENFGDVPFYPERVPAHVLTCMTRVASELPRENKFVVANVLRNDAAGALSVAAAAGLQAIRVNVHCGTMVTDQGIIEGRAAETVRLRREVAPDVAILADVDVKHATPLASGFSLPDAACETAYRGLADALIVTGRSTGAEAAPTDVEVVRRAVPDRPTFVGSGVTAESVERWLRIADGVIVGSWLKEDGQVEKAVDARRARDFIHAARSSS